MASLPEKLGRYQVVGLLATGGMAEILLGRVQGPSGFERPVVIKRVLPHLARTRTFVDMFLDEARILASIRHPNVVQVHELGRDGEDLFLVLEFLEGESLGTLVRRLGQREQRLPHALSAFVVAEACAGLHAAHELVDPEGHPLDLVHRDVTPHNIFITYDGQVKVIDFGIAQAARRLAHTEPGHVKGKFAYMSPEQCLGMTLDRRSDIFSLGIVLFELGTGRRLFKRDNDLLTLKAICQDRYPRPTVVEPSCPLALEQVVIGALRRSPENRYPTAAAMRQQLRLVQRELPLDELPSDALASLMRTLFAARIEEKQSLVRRVQAGSEVTLMPAAELDRELGLPEVQAFSFRNAAEWIDDPPSEAATTLPTSPFARATDSSTPAGLAGRASATATAGVEPRAARRRRSITLVASVGLLLAAVAAVGWWLGPRTPVGPPVGATAPASSLGPATASSVAVDAEALDGSSTSMVRLSVKSDPPGATVSVAGLERGTTPAELTIERSTQPVELILRRDGYLSMVEQIVPDTDSRLHYVLRPARRARPPSTTNPVSTGSGRGFRRFD